MDYFMEAVKLGKEGMESNCGGPFGAVVVKNGKIIGRGYNRVLCDNDPTAHAEVVAIRDACKNENAFWLKDAEIYTVCEPCPMCLSAIYWAHIDKIYFANTHKEAADIGFDDSRLYQELKLDVSSRSLPSNQITSKEAQALFAQWKNKTDKTPY